MLAGYPSQKFLPLRGGFTCKRALTSVNYCISPADPMFAAEWSLHCLPEFSSAPVLDPLVVEYVQDVLPILKLSGLFNSLATVIELCWHLTDLDPVEGYCFYT